MNLNKFFKKRQFILILLIYLNKIGQFWIFFPFFQALTFKVKCKGTIGKILGLIESHDQCEPWL